MSIHLKNRRQPGPNGFLFHERRTDWKSWIIDPLTQYDFALLCQRYQQHAQANPSLALPTDLPTIENMIDLANALRYLQIKGGDYYVLRTGGPDPKTQPPSKLAAAAAVVAGGKVLIEWIKSGEEAVPQDLANKRASICATCPQNGPGDWTRFFTEPAQRAIQAEYERRKEMKLSTVHDGQLRICEACQCPLKLKVHMPLERAKSKLTGEQIARLDPRCWMLNEVPNPP